MAGEVILLVDDETNIIDLTSLYLKKEGFHTLCGGRIVVESQPGKGSRFTVKIPAAV